MGLGLLGDGRVWNPGFTDQSFIRNLKTAAREMPQQLRVLAALTEDLSWFPEPMWVLTAAYNFASRGPDPPLDFTDTCSHLHILPDTHN